MSKITALRSGGGRRKKVEVFPDGRIALKFEEEIATREGERKKPSGQADDFQRCLNVALTYLNYRPRSEAELRQRLGWRGFSLAVQNTVINKLTKQKLLDDTAFAQFWKDNRETFRPQSQRLTRLELKQKGVADDVIDHAVEEMDDEASAHRAAQSKIRQLAGADYMSFRRRLGGYLQRRGFSSSVISRTLERAWDDQRGRDNPSRPGSQQKER
ncbi:MAG: regulatory protein RecX [Chloroflexi bacterium]|nr:regulatory protein RecX [Chloroflexota bacterium]